MIFFHTLIFEYFCSLLYSIYTYSYYTFELSFFSILFIYTAILQYSLYFLYTFLFDFFQLGIARGSALSNKFSFQAQCLCHILCALQMMSTQLSGMCHPTTTKPLVKQFVCVLIFVVCLLSVCLVLVFGSVYM